MIEQKQQTCEKCNKIAYITEIIHIEYRPYHKTCFKCEKCKKQLGTVGYFQSREGALFCKVHKPAVSYGTGPISVSPQYYPGLDSRKSSFASLYERAPSPSASSNKIDEVGTPVKNTPKDLNINTALSPLRNQDYVSAQSALEPSASSTLSAPPVIPRTLTVQRAPQKLDQDPLSRSNLTSWRKEFGSGNCLLLFNLRSESLKTPPRNSRNTVTGAHTVANPSSQKIDADPSDPETMLAASKTVEGKTNVSPEGKNTEISHNKVNLTGRTPLLINTISKPNPGSEMDLLSPFDMEKVHEGLSTTLQYPLNSQQSPTEPNFTPPVKQYRRRTLELLHSPSPASLDKTSKSHSKADMPSISQELRVGNPLMERKKSDASEVLLNGTKSKTLTFSNIPIDLEMSPAAKKQGSKEPELAGDHSETNSRNAKLHVRSKTDVGLDDLPRSHSKTFSGGQSKPQKFQSRTKITHFIPRNSSEQEIVPANASNSNEQKNPKPEEKWVVTVEASSNVPDHTILTPSPGKTLNEHKRNELILFSYQQVKLASLGVLKCCDTLFIVTQDGRIALLQEFVASFRLLRDSLRKFIELTTNLASLDLRRSGVDIVKFEVLMTTEFLLGNGNTPNTESFKTLIAATNTNIDNVMRKFQPESKMMFKATPGYKEESCYENPFFLQKLSIYQNAVLEHAPEDRYFRENFKGFPHVTFCGTLEKWGPVIISILKDEPDFTDKEGVYKLIIRRKESEIVRYETINSSQVKKSMLSRKASVKQVLAILDKSINFSKLKSRDADEQVDAQLLALDEFRYRRSCYKFGILLCKPGQSTDNEYFSNCEGSPEYNAFLESIATFQRLKNFEGYSAGLDTVYDKTGLLFLHTKWRDFEIAFHCATLLPFRAEDPQQIERKRHLGNDIINIIYMDGDMAFDPTTIKTQFTHIYILVKAENDFSGYRVSIIYNTDVPKFGPPLPNPPVFRDMAVLREFLMAKLVNAENAGLKAPKFFKPNAKARQGLFDSIIEEFSSASMLKMTSSSSGGAGRVSSVKNQPILSPLTTTASMNGLHTIPIVISDSATSPKGNRGSIMQLVRGKSTPYLLPPTSISTHPRQSKVMHSFQGAPGIIE